MCGIAGWFEARPSETRVPLARMLHQMASRGPDDCAQSEVAVRSGGRLLLGARRLAILDLTFAARQPMRDPQTGNQVLLNGEIYNFCNLRRELECGGYRFRSGGDAEVVLAGYALWGEALVEHLRGMFAIAIWNEARQSLTLIRDRLGIKPLYYAEVGGNFLFASQLRAIAASGLVPRDLDDAGLYSLLQFGSVQEPATLLRGVRTLPAGHFLRWQAETKRAELHRYWSLPVSAGNEGNGRRTRAQAISQLRERLEEVSKLHVVSDVAVGSFLSGGLDSAAVTALAARTGAPISSFCVSFSNSRHDESGAALRAARHIGCAHRDVRLEPEEAHAAVPLAIRALDQPSVDGVNTWFVARAAHDAGIKVALSGLGGDELFAGYNTFRRVPRLERAMRLPRWLRVVAGNVVGSRAFPRGDRVGAWLRGDMGGHPYFATRRLFPHARIAQLLQPGWMLEADPAHTDEDLLEYRRLLSETDAIHRVSALEISLYLRNTVLRDTDCASMAHPVEVRVPLLDHLLVEDVLSMPGNWKIRAGVNKPLLAEAVAPWLPASILRQPKRAFELPWDSWLRGSLRAQVSEVLSEPGEHLHSVLQWAPVQQLWEGFLKGRVHWSRPWLLFVLKQWAEEHMRGARVDVREGSDAPLSKAGVAA